MKLLIVLMVVGGCATPVEPLAPRELNDVRTCTQWMAQNGKHVCVAYDG